MEEHTQVDGIPKDEPERLRDNDVGVPAFRKVDHEKRDRGNDGNWKLVSPSDVKNVVQEAEEGCNK